MAYREPGAYSKLDWGNDLDIPTAAVLMRPLIIGEGPKILKATHIIKRGEGLEDILPIAATKILSIGKTRTKANYKPGAEADYTHEEGTNTIKWGEESTNKPATGDNYYVTFLHEVTQDQYELKRISTMDDITENYGGQFLEGTEPDSKEINRLALAAELCKRSGATEFFVLQVEPNDEGKVGAAEYEKALRNHAMFNDEIHKIVPLDHSKPVLAVIDAHLELASSFEERKERRAYYTLKEAEEIYEVDELIETLGSYAKDKQYERVSMLYPSTAMSVLDDGNSYELDGAFVAAAYAGMKAGKPIQQSATNSALPPVFTHLTGVKMLRTEMNKLAEHGVTILEQPNTRGSITVRHQLTTNMNSVEMREDSIQEIGDYVSKALRNTAKVYIGKFNITGELIAQAETALVDRLMEIKGSKIITSYQFDGIEQDAKNPDTLIVKAKIKPPYPCNYIDILIFVD